MTLCLQSSAASFHATLRDKLQSHEAIAKRWTYFSSQGFLRQYCIALQCNAMQCIALHCITLHCIV